MKNKNMKIKDVVMYWLWVICVLCPVFLTVIHGSFIFVAVAGWVYAVKRYSWVREFSERVDDSGFYAVLIPSVGYLIAFFIIGLIFAMGRLLT